MNISGSCRICNADIKPFMSFGSMPLANAFLKETEFSNEYFFDLSVCFCESCFALQLTKQPPRELMFHEQYPFFTGSSKLMTKHFSEFSNEVSSRYLKTQDPFVVELGSNDGTLLLNFKERGMRLLGIEPSESVADVARQKGIQTLGKFFDEDLAQQIVAEHGQADLFLAANVMCHIPDLHAVVKGAKLLLKKSGVMVFEDPYLGDMLQKTSYDQIYDEHVYLFSLHSIKFLFETHGMEIVDVEAQSTHGGSMRYTAAHRGQHAVRDRVTDLLNKERQNAVGDPKTYITFKEKCECSKKKLTEILESLHKQGKRVVGYAATSKSTTVLNYCKVQPEWIEYISDTTPMKQGKFSPGVHIPIRPYEEFKNNPPDYALLFGWNHREEIMQKEKVFTENGGKWILYVPEVEVL